MARRKSRRVAAKLNDGTQPRKTVGIDCAQRNRPSVQRPIKLQYQNALIERFLFNLEAAPDNLPERSYLVGIAALRGPLPFRNEVGGNFINRTNVNLPCAVGERVDQQGPADHRPAGREAYDHDRVGADFRDYPDRRDARPPCHLNFQAFCSLPAAFGRVTLSGDSVVPICVSHAPIAILLSLLI